MKTQPLIMQTNDEPSMALLVLQIRRNPGKRVKMPSVAFLPTSFLRKLAVFLLLTFDAPSLALLVCGGKNASESGRRVATDTVEK